MGIEYSVFIILYSSSFETLPENTLGAFENAVKHGYGIEFDVWRTNDGQLIVHHDPKLNRTCGKNIYTKSIDRSAILYLFP